jgi:hypothetical protein
MSTTPNKKSGLFGFLFPYILMGVAVIVFIWLIFFQNPGTTITVGQTDLAEFLNTQEVTQVTTTEKQTITQVTGTFVDGDGKTMYFTATYETSNIYIKDAVDEVLATRPGPNLARSITMPTFGRAKTPSRPIGLRLGVPPSC